MRVKDLITIKQGLGEGQAEFWLMRRGDGSVCGRPMWLEDFKDTWGEPKPDYALYHWGVNLRPSCHLEPEQVFWQLQAVWCSGIFDRWSHGSLNLKNITKDSILRQELPSEMVRVQLPPRRVVLGGDSYWLYPDGHRGTVHRSVIVDEADLLRLGRSVGSLEGSVGELEHKETATG